MDHVLAKVKRLRKNPYKKLLSDSSLFPSVDLTSASTVHYSSDHSLDEDSWFIIKKFSEQDFFLRDLKQHLDSKNFDNISKNQFTEISYVLSIQGQDVYFQKVTPSSFIDRKLISFGDVAYLEENANRLLVKSEADAVFVRSKDILLFKNLETISSIFKGIDRLYREATEAEVKEFLKSDFLDVSSDYDHSAVSKPNRKRLALYSDTIKSMTKDQKNSLVEDMKEYCADTVEFAADGQRFKVSNDIHLKLILYGIGERYYTTRHSKEKRLASSVEVLN